MSAEYDEFLSTSELDIARPRKIIDDEMDLTPMVDVTFLLLVFFMVTAAFAVQKAINVPPIPDQEAAVAQTLDDLEQESYVIRVDADNVFWVGLPGATEEQRALSPAELRSQLRGARTDQAGAGLAKLLVKAHGDSRHESVVAALDAGAGAGLSEIRLLSYEDGDLEL